MEKNPMIHSLSNDQQQTSNNKVNIIDDECCDEKQQPQPPPFLLSSPCCSSSSSPSSISINNLHSTLFKRLPKIISSTSSSISPIELTTNNKDSTIIKSDENSLNNDNNSPSNDDVNDVQETEEVEEEEEEEEGVVDNEEDRLPPITNIKQYEEDKKAIYGHPLFPLLGYLFEKCEQATRSIDSFENDTTLKDFNSEIETFINCQQSLGRSFFTNDHEVDSLMIKAIQVFRIHLLEMEKVYELCQHFCERYIDCLKQNMRTETLINRIRDNSGKLFHEDMEEEDEEEEEGVEIMEPEEDDTIIHNDPSIYNKRNENDIFFCSNSSSNSSSNNSSSFISSSASPPSPSSSTSYLCSSPQVMINNNLLTNNNNLSVSTTNTSSSSSRQIFPLTTCPSITTHNQCPNSLRNSRTSVIIETTTKSSNSHDDDDCDDIELIQDLSWKKHHHKESNNETKPEIQALVSSKSKDVKILNLSSQQQQAQPQQNTPNTPTNTPSKPKRGALPKQATSIMRSWLFQHITHPYPNEDEKHAIATETNLTLLQVNNWFINARRRILHPMLDSIKNFYHQQKPPSSSSSALDIINNTSSDEDVCQKELDLSIKKKPVSTSTTNTTTSGKNLMLISGQAAAMNFVEPKMTKKRLKSHPTRDTNHHQMQQTSTNNKRKL